MSFRYENVRVEAITDGDTIDVILDLGFHVQLRQRVRLFGFNCPERGQPGYREAGVFLDQILTVTDPWQAARSSDRFQRLTLLTIKPREKYGRFLADAFLPDGRSVADVMIEAGHAVPYLGGTR